MTQDQRDQAEVELREQYQDLAHKQSEIQDDVNTRRNELMSELQHTLHAGRAELRQAAAV